MSLTSVTRHTAVRQLFSEYFKKPTLALNLDLKAPPLTNHYQVIGNAFDYLLRFVLKYHYPEAVDSTWVAEDAVSRFSNDETMFSLAQGSLMYAKDAYQQYLDHGEITADLLRSAIYLGKLDLAVRAGYLDERIMNVAEEDLTDLLNMISIVNIEDFKPGSHCLLNPTFGIGSLLVGGADVDLVIDKQIIDIKTSKKLDVRREMYNQIIGYYILASIGGIQAGEAYLDDAEIEEIGFYFARYGYKCMYRVDDIINDDTLEIFIERFRKVIDDEGLA